MYVLGFYLLLVNYISQIAFKQHTNSSRYILKRPRPQGMLFLILALFIGAAYWLVASFLCFKFLYKHINGRFQKVFKNSQQPTEEEFRPFHRTDFGQWDLDQIYFNCFALFPIRFFLMFHIVTTLGISVLVVSRIERHLLGGRKSPFLRKVQQMVARGYAARIMRWVFCSVNEISVNEAPRIPEPIFVSNHICWFEIFYIICSKWPVSFLAKDDVARIPIIGEIATFVDSFFVNRNDEKNREETIQKIKARVEMSAKGEMPPLLIFPEGTTTNGKYLITFKRGAFEPLSKLRLIGLKYVCPRFNCGMDEMGQVANFLLFLCHSPSLIILEEHNVQPKVKQEDAYTQQCRKRLSEILQIPLNPGRFRDGQRYSQIRNSPEY